MAHIIKKGPIKVPTQPKNFDLQATGLVFKSYDNQIALEFNVEQQDGTPADLLGANLRLLMFIYDEVDGTIKKEPIPFITKNLITESFLNGHVVYILPEAMKAYNGVVEAYVYIEYPDGSTSDNLGFTFRMKRSAIDGLAQDKADYFIEDFKQLLEAASLEANKVIEGLDTEIKNLQQAAKNANAAVDGAMDRIDGLEAEIGQLERLREMYIDTLDFEGYDYSGRPNLMLNLDFSKLSGASTAVTKLPAYVKDDGSCFTIDCNDPSAAGTSRSVYIPNVSRLEKGATYLISVPMFVSQDFSGDFKSVSFNPYNAIASGEVKRIASVNPNETCRNEWQTIKTAFTVPEDFPYGDSAPYAQLWVNAPVTGGIQIGYDIKVERVNSTSDQATPFQPNLLAEPYNMCREYPNENIADPAVSFPIKTSAYRLYGANMLEEFKVGQRYTITIKGTKPATQDFWVYNSGDVSLGKMKPVEGLVDVWTLSFKLNTINSGQPRLLSIYQTPQLTVGACQLDWLKIEKGDTRTPIDAPTYKGLGILDSNDPTKYVWNYTELVDVDGIQDALENVEQRTVTLEGKANTIDGRLSNVNTTLNTVQSTADQILAEVTAADVMKETDLPGYLSNKPIVAGGTADFSDKVAQKVHPTPHKCANYALAYEHANQVPSKAVYYETTQDGYDKISKLDGSTFPSSTDTIGQTANFAFKFDLISQITKDYPSFFDDCPTREKKVAKIQKHIISATLTLNAKTTNTSLYVAAALNDGWNVEKEYAATSQITEQKYAVLNYNSITRSYIQNDGSIVFRARTRTLDAAGTVQIRTDYVRFDYTLDLSSDDFITPIERDVTKDNLTQILSDDSATIKGVMDFKFKTRGNNDLCPHAAYEAGSKPQAVNMSQLNYEAEANVYNQIQNKADGLTRLLATNSEVGNVPQVKYKFDLVTAIEKEHPHLFKGLTTTQQKVNVLKAKLTGYTFNVYARTEGANGQIYVGTSSANSDTIASIVTRDVGQTTEFAKASYPVTHVNAINADGTVLFYLRGVPTDSTYTQPKIIIDYVNLEYTLSDKPSDYVVTKTDATYLAAVAKTKELDRYKEYFDKGKAFGADTAKLTTITPGASLGVHGTRAVTVNNGVFTATKVCKLMFDFSVKMRGNTNTPYNYIFAYKNGLKADEDAVAALGGFGISGGTATLKFQTNVPLKYIVDMNKDDTLEFKTDFGDSPNKIQEVRMLFGTIEEI
ncbi:BppU family phage baseplate upper protein [Enterococcus faecium]|uniref:BppU family phage baseplate upper protein n=1 Tax=Enterococcus sp. BSD2780120874b_170522_B6 TaxID=2755567 RepID=UPI0018A9EF7A|nr:BppU family phage baseplate upper protein [Enterococcus sp. BSD2780120874b_170522_B6]NTK24118.1 BppU family phage baseplate upper protein [Enterococcus faecium]